MNRKKWIAATALAGAAVGSLWAQTDISKQLDAAVVRQELEIMEGILHKTVEFAVDTPSRVHRLVYLSEENVRGFYLVGQGAVFLVPIPGGRETLAPYVELSGLESYMDALEDQHLATDEMLRALEGQIEAAVSAAQVDIERNWDLLRPKSAEFSEAPEAPPAPKTPGPPPSPPDPQQPEPPAPPEKPAPPAVPQPSRAAAAAARDRVQQRLKQMKVRLASKKEEREKVRQELEETRAKIREKLVDVLSRHGDSLSMVKPNEYISLILTPGWSGGWGYTPLGAERGKGWSNRVLSVQKSSVLDYKAGKLNRSQFLARIQEYEM